MSRSFSAEQSAAHQSRILDRPRRIDPPTEITEEMQTLAGPPKGFGQPGVLPEVYAVMLKNMGLLRNFRGLGEFFLVYNQIPSRDRELAILRVAWLTQSPFEWGEHVTIGKKCDVTDEEIERLTQGSTAQGWSDHDRAVIRAVEELIENAIMSDETWNTLAQSWNEAQLVELPFLIGTYQSLAYFFNTVGLRLRDTNPGLVAR